ncbi:MAG: hypothetical protein KME30_10920 [Iphinoe sp. HA4291-MV1]|jgi:cell division protein FtsB|nr:hypothetical protein [Iphinoe sp. HA4291-MV1]
MSNKEDILRSEIDGLSAEVVGLRAEVADLKAEMAAFKAALDEKIQSAILRAQSENMKSQFKKEFSESSDE